MNKYTHFYRLFVLFVPVFFAFNAFTQTTLIKLELNNNTGIELDDFLYADTVSNAIKYEFSVQIDTTGASYEIQKVNNYFCLNEISDIAYYGTEYSVRTRFYSLTDTSAYGPAVHFTTSERQRYFYGTVIAKVLPGFEDYIHSYDSTFQSQPEIYIDGFGELHQSCNFNKIEKTFNEILNVAPALSGIYTFKFDPSFSTDSVILFLLHCGIFEYVEKEMVMYKSVNDPLVNNPSLCIDCSGCIHNSQWALQEPYFNIGQIASMIDNTEEHIIKVAIVDDAVRYDHEDLQDNIWINQTEIPENIRNEILSNPDYIIYDNNIVDAQELIQYCNDALPGTEIETLKDIIDNQASLSLFDGFDNDFNLYVDDIIGWDCANDNNDPFPFDVSDSWWSHGTHVAGIVGAVTDNNLGIASLSLNRVRIIPVKSKADFTSGNQLNSTIDGIKYAIAAGANIINMSWGSEYAPDDFLYNNALQNAINEASELGIVLIAAMGNDGYEVINTPANLDNVLAVGSTNSDLNISGFSTTGDHMDFLAPGQDILSTCADSRSSYCCKDGTSMACPMFASLWALIQSINPNASYDDILNCIGNNTIVAISNWDSNQGYGLINPIPAVQCAGSLPPVASFDSDASWICPSTYTFYSTSAVTYAISYEWTANPSNGVIFSDLDGESTDITFPGTGTFSISLEVCSQYPGEAIFCDSHTEDIVVQYPTIQCIGGNNITQCAGANTILPVEFNGTPPFTLQYEFDNQAPVLIEDIYSNNFNILLDTYNDEPDDFSFDVTYFADSHCDGNTISVNIEIAQCFVNCQAKHNQIMHMIPASANGDNDGIYFDPLTNNAMVVASPMPFANTLIEGIASISDVNGIPILTAQGGNIYYNNNQYALFMNFGTSAIQGSLILPDFLGQQNVYYAFFVAHNDGTTSSCDLRCTKIDLNSSDPVFIDISPYNYNGDEHEMMTACKIIGEPGYWIITREIDKFNIYKMDGQNPLSFDHAEEIGATFSDATIFGKMVFSPDMNRLAVSYTTSNIKKIEIYNFNRDINYSGNRLDLQSVIQLNEQPGPIEFSPDGSKLYYYSLHGLSQIDLSNSNSNVNIYNEIFDDGYVMRGGLRLGPDGYIYVNHTPPTVTGGIVTSHGAVGVIYNPNLPGNECEFVPNVIESDFHYGFPPRVPSSEIYFDLTTNCLHQLVVENLGGVGPFSFLWNTGENTQSISIYQPGTYTVTVTSMEGCQRIETFDYNGTLSLTISGISAACNGNGEIDFTIDGGNSPYQVDLYRDNIGIINQFVYENEGDYSINGLPADNYTLSVTDDNGCIQVITFEIIPELQQLDLGDDIELCFYDLPITLDAGEGMVSYLWSTSNNTQTIVVNAGGVYQVTVTDMNNCTASDEITITSNEPINFGPDKVICDYYVPHVLNAGNGYAQYLWNDNSNSQTIEAYTTGVYSVTATDDNGCTASDEMFLTVISSPVVNIGSDQSICESSLPFNIDAGAGSGYSYVWNTSEHTQTIDVTSPGEYSVTVTNANSCSATDAILISILESPVVSAGNDHEICEGNSVKLLTNVYNGLPPYNYLWNHSETILPPDDQASPNIEVMPPQTTIYSVTVTDANGCTSSDEVIVYVNYNPELLEITATPLEVCLGQSTVLNAVGTGGTPDYTYSWDNGLGYGQSHTVIPDAQATYTVTISDAEGCSVSGSVTVNFNNPPDISVEINPECENLSNGSIDITLNNATPPVNFVWSNNSTEQSISGLTQGIYSLTITDGSNCTYTQTYEVPLEPIISLTAETVPAYGGNNGSVVLSFSPNNLSGFSLILTNSLGTVIPPVFNNINLSENIIIDNLQDGTYTATLVSQYCPSSSIDFTIDYIDVLELNCHLLPITCQVPGKENGAVGFTISGGEAPYMVNIYLNGNSFSLLNQYSESGSYEILLTGISQSNIVVMVNIIDANGIVQECSFEGYVDYAWAGANGLILTNANLANSTTYTDKIICVGSSSDQTLIFNNNCTFTNCTIYTATMAYTNVTQTQWTVNAPYDLKINYSNIQSGCPDKMWQGIKVIGQNSTQSTSTHGLAEVKYSTVSDAMKAVESTTGGIIKAQYSDFKNNRYGLYFNTFNYDHSQSSILKNDFITDKFLNNLSYCPMAHVYLYSVKGISFNGNNFKNTLPWTPYYLGYTYYTDYRGYGIHSLLSSFTVTSMNTSLWLPMMPSYVNTFEGMYYGIYASGQKTTAPYIYYNTFTNNFRGAIVSSSTGPRVLFNNFNTTNEDAVLSYTPVIINGTPAATVSYAAYINSCQDYSVEENSAINGDAGIYIYNTGDAEGQELFRNTFGENASDGNSVGNAAVIVGRNSDHFNQTGNGVMGLQVRCNNFIDNTKAISVVNGNMRLNQGEPNGTTDQLAGNQFHEIYTNGFDFTVNIAPAYSGFAYTDTYQYYHHDDNVSIDNDYKREPFENISGVTKHPQLGIGFTSASCLSNYTPNIIVIDLPVVFNSISNLESQLSDLKQSYDSIVDKGNTEYMKAVATLMNDDNYVNAYNILDNNGYLTDTVLTALLCNEFAPTVAITAILIANSPLPEKVIKLIDQVRLDDGLKTLLKSYQIGLNARVAIEYQMAGLKQEISRLETKLVNHSISNDSIPAVRREVLMYFKNKKEKSAKDFINIYRLYQADGELESSLGSLYDLRNFAMNQEPKHSGELMKYCDINEIFLNLPGQVGMDAEKDKEYLGEHKEMLFEAARDEAPLYSALAEILYELAMDTVFAEYTPLPWDEVTPKSIETQIITQSSNMFSPTLKVYPNPNDGLIFVEYDFSRVSDEAFTLLYRAMGYSPEANCKNGELKIYTDDGKLLQTLALNRAADLKTIDATGYAAGAYLIELTDCYGNKNTVKITKNR